MHKSENIDIHQRKPRYRTGNMSKDLNTRYQSESNFLQVISKFIYTLNVFCSKITSFITKHEVYSKIFVEREIQK
jgi:hypothetical protein